MLALNNLLAQFNKVLYEVDLLRDERVNMDQVYNKSVTPSSQYENISIRRLKSIFANAKYSASNWRMVLGNCRASTKEEVEKINLQFDKEMMIRTRLDVYFNFQGMDVDDIRSFCIQRLKDLKGYANFTARYESNNPRKGLPEDADIIVYGFVCYVLDKYPGFELLKDFESIFQNYQYSKLTGHRLADEFKIKKTLEERFYYVRIDGLDVLCQQGGNNALAVCLYFSHYIQRIRVVENQQEAITNPDSARIEALLKTVSIGGQFKLRN